MCGGEGERKVSTIQESPALCVLAGVSNSTANLKQFNTLHSIKKAMDVQWNQPGSHFFQTTSKRLVKVHLVMLRHRLYHNIH